MKDRMLRAHGGSLLLCVWGGLLSVHCGCDDALKNSNDDDNNDDGDDDKEYDDDDSNQGGVAMSGSNGNEPNHLSAGRHGICLDVHAVIALTPSA